jgi:hypothetical protein
VRQNGQAHNIEETDYSDCINIVGNIGVRQRFKVRIKVRARVQDRIRWDGKCDVVTDYSHGLQSRIITVTDYYSHGLLQSQITVKDRSRWDGKCSQEAE